MLIEFFFSKVNVVPFNTRVGPSPRIKITFLLLSTYTEELRSTTKIIQFLPNPLLKKFPFYQIQYHI